VDSQGLEPLSGGWEHGGSLRASHGNYVPPPVGPGDFLFDPLLPGALDAVRVEYRFDAGTDAQLVEKGDASKVYHLRAPGGEIDLPTELGRSWILRLPAGTSVHLGVIAWHWDMEKLTKPKPEIAPEVWEYVHRRRAKMKEEDRLRIAKWREEFPLPNLDDCKE